MKSFFGLILAILFLFSPAALRAQVEVDKMLVTVSDGVRTELITYSDLLWQLALQPGSSIESPSKEDLNRVLQRLIEQRLIALEAERLPAAAPTDAEIEAEIRRIITAFGSPVTLAARLRRVGFESADDPNLRRIVEQRLAIEKYLNFRFRSFVVITPLDEERFYSETFVPRFRQANPGVVVPTLEQSRKQINAELTENRVEADIERFLTEARERAIITTLNQI